MALFDHCNVKHKIRNFGFIKENFWFGHFYEFCDNATGSNRRGHKVKVNVIKRIPYAYVTEIGKYVIVSARHGLTEFIFLYRPRVGGGGGGGIGSEIVSALETVSSQLTGFQQAKSLPPFQAPWPPISLALPPPPYSKPFYACDNICM